MRDENLHAHYTWEAGYWRRCAATERRLSLASASVGLGCCWGAMQYSFPLVLILALLMFGMAVEGWLIARRHDAWAARADERAERWRA